MTLTDALAIKSWTPLREVVVDATEVAPGVFAIASNVYLQTQPFNAAFETNLPNAPFVTLLYWASCLPAVQRLLLGNPSVEVGAEARPPGNLVFNTDGTYGQLLAQVPATQQKSAEMAQYNSKGAFLYKKIELFPFTYYFSNLKISKGERTCLIAVRLPK